MSEQDRGPAAAEPTRLGEHKVWHVISSVDPANGGTTRAVVEIVALLRSRGVDSRLITFSGLEALQRHDELWGKLQRCGAPIRLLPAAYPALRLAGLKRQRWTPERGDILHCHGVWEPNLWLLARLARRAGSPYIVFPHGMLDTWSLAQSRFKKWIATRLAVSAYLRHASGIQCLTNFDASEIELLRLSTRRFTIPNGVDLREVQSPSDIGVLLKTCPKLRAHSFKIVFMARIHPKKGLLEVIDALSLIKHSHPNVDLLVAGPIEDRRYYQHCKNRAAELLDRVHFMGEVKGSLKRTLLSSADAFILASHQEGFSLSILEAMECSAPVIITAQCHFDEVAESGAGRVIAQPDPKLIANAIRDLTDLSPAEAARMRQCARQLVEQHYTWSEVAPAIIDMYSSVTSSHRG